MQKKYSLEKQESGMINSRKINLSALYFQPSDTNFFFRTLTPSLQKKDGLNVLTITNDTGTRILIQLQMKSQRKVFKITPKEQVMQHGTKMTATVEKIGNIFVKDEFIKVKWNQLLKSQPNEMKYQRCIFIEQQERILQQSSLQSPNQRNWKDLTNQQIEKNIQFKQFNDDQFFLKTNDVKQHKISQNQLFDNTYSLLKTSVLIYVTVISFVLGYLFA